jgi:hypothetical protein
MIVTKTKDYSLLSTSEVKEHLAIFSGDTTYDNLITRYIQTACNEAEKYLDNDVAKTVCVLEESSYIYPFVYLCYELNETNVNITGITVTNIVGNTANTVTLVNGTDYFVEKNNNYTLIKFRNCISGNVLKIYYASGYQTEIPPSIKHAVAVRIGTYLDAERNEYVANNMTDTKAFYRLLSPYKNI